PHPNPPSVPTRRSPDLTSGTGTCSVTAHKAGDDNYSAADSADHAVTINKAAQATLTVTYPDAGTYGDKLVPTASGGSGTGALTFDRKSTRLNSSHSHSS